MKKLLIGGAAVAAISAALVQLPDLKRYLRIRNM